MRTKTIMSPVGWVLSDLLAIIEHDPEAFTQGRRNNDLVNWFITKKLIDLDSEQQPKVWTEYVDDFKDMRENLSNMQKQHLTHWTEDAEWKVRVLTEHYGHWSHDKAIINLWLPMNYSVQEV